MAPQHPDPWSTKRISEPELMNLSTARPPVGDLDLARFAPQHRQSGQGSASRVYDTSSYLERVQEEDPWPNQASADQGTLSISKCRFLDPAPIDLSKPVRVACEVAWSGELGPSDQDVSFQLHTIHRDHEYDDEAPEGAAVTVRVKGSNPATVECTIPAPGTMPRPEKTPRFEIWLRAEAKNSDRNLSAKSPPTPSLPWPTVVRRVRLSGSVFDANRCFLLPEALDGIRQAVELHRQHPMDQVVIVGHAESDEDLAGPTLARDRARAVRALVTNRWEDWLPWFAESSPERSRWGVREAQSILGCLGLYQGQAAGILDQATTKALQAFQKSVSEKGAVRLETSGKIDSATRKELLRAYFGQEKTTFSQSTDPVVVGCAGHASQEVGPDGNPLDPRRLEILFFETRYDPKAPADTLAEGNPVYAQWMKLVAQTIEADCHSFSVQVRDHRRRVVPLAEVEYAGPTTGRVQADQHGFARITGVKPGKYRIKASLDGAVVAMASLSYPTAKTDPSPSLPRTNPQEVRP